MITEPYPQIFPGMIYRYRTSPQILVVVSGARFNNPDKGGEAVFYDPLNRVTDRAASHFAEWPPMEDWN